MDVGLLGIKPHRLVFRMNDNTHKVHSRHLILYSCYYFHCCYYNHVWNQTNSFEQRRVFSNRVLGSSIGFHKSQISSWAAVIALITSVSIIRKPQDAITGIYMENLLCMKNGFIITIRAELLSSQFSLRPEVLPPTFSPQLDSKNSNSERWKRLKDAVKKSTHFLFKQFVAKKTS